MFKGVSKKLIISIGTLALVISLSSPVYADLAGLNRIKSWIATAIVAGNIALTPVNYAYQHGIQNAVDPLGLIDLPIENEMAEYFDRSVIHIDDNVAVIDGVEYSDIWLSHDVADKFRVNVGDFVTAYNIASESDGTYASGVGYYRGLPVFSVNDVYRTQTANFSVGSSFSYGDDIISSGQSYSSGYYYVTIDGGIAGAYDTLKTPILGKPAGFYWRISPSSSTPGRRSIVTPFYPDGHLFSGYVGGTFTSSFFDFDYVSGVIDADPLPSDYGLRVRVPTSYNDPDSGQPVYNIQNIINNFPSQSGGNEINLDPEINPDFQIDSDFLDTLGDLINTILNIYDLFNDGPSGIEVVNEPYEEPAPPVPDPYPDPDVPPVPEPGTSLPDVDFVDLDSIIRLISEHLQNIKNILEDFLQDILDGINNIIENLSQWFNDILDALQDILQSLQDILDHLIEDLAEAPIKLFDKALDVLKSLFLPIIGFIKTHLGIWHYVVEWFASISAVFAFFFGIVNSTSYYIVLPIYALIAGTIVIAVYKRFGR